MVCYGGFSKCHAGDTSRLASHATVLCVIDPFQVSSLYAHDATVEKGPMYLLLLLLSGFEIVCGVPKVFQLLNDPDATPPGDYKFDPLGERGLAV